MLHSRILLYWAKLITSKDNTSQKDSIIGARELNDTGVQDPSTPISAKTIIVDWLDTGLTTAPSRICLAFAFHLITCSNNTIVCRRINEPVRHCESRAYVEDKNVSDVWLGSLWDTCLASRAPPFQRAPFRHSFRALVDAIRRSALPRVEAQVEVCTLSFST